LNDRGQLGDNGTETRPTPTPVAGAHVFKSLTAGGRTTCGITVDDALLCWGGGLFRVNGASPDELTTPTHVAAERQFALAETSGYHTCGVTPGGATYCWGDNTHGQLGVAAVDSICGSFPCTREPQEVASTPPFVDLALGGDFSCGLTAGGVAHCWGGNAHGQLGDGTRTDRWEVMPVAGGRSFTRLDAGQQYACGVDGAGLLYCWGRDPSGFGNGGDRVEVDEPVPGASGLTFTEIAIGLSTQCGVAHSGVTWCWGSNLDGAVGNGRSQRIGLVTTPMRVIRHPAR
jgi:alpha-tubulin suppressor-like RCC1 family protein